MLAALFWVSAGWVVYTYAGYPIAVSVLSKLRPRPSLRASIEPSVSVILAVRNEAARVAKKLENLLRLDYPRSKLEIIVVCDGSTDATVSIAKSFEDEGVKVEVLAQPSGKPVALNRGVALATGDLLLFCDARQRIDRGALRALVAHFADGAVGAVSGELMLDSEKGPGFYWKYEKWIRSAEAQVDSVPGATGALYAMRRALFEEVPTDCLLDDVYTPMRVVLAGKRVLFEPNAKAYDGEVDLTGEFQRKARTLAGNFQLLRHLPEVLHPGKNRILWQFGSHKLARLACPYALLSLLATSAALALQPPPLGPIYASCLGGQLLLYGLAAHGALRGERAGRVARVACTFVALNAAAVEGLRRYLTGNLSWTSAERHGSSRR